MMKTEAVIEGVRGMAVYMQKERMSGNRLSCGDI